ncbi:hypothetical protein MKX01_021128 [Papaver californicum]|nr:hypothetical protein MKX01_021128 [Papaver californicum]
MGSTNWFKTIVCQENVKKEKVKQAKTGYKWIKTEEWESQGFRPSVEDIAATRIQTAFRGYKSKIQDAIRARRVHIVTEGRFKQRKLGSQLKHEARFMSLRDNSNPNHERIAYEANWSWSWVELKKCPSAKKLFFPVKSTLSNGNEVVKVKKQYNVKPVKPAIEKSNSNGEVVSASTSKTEKTIIKREVVS